MIVSEKVILTIISTISGVVLGGFIGFYGLLSFILYTQLGGFWPLFIITVPLGMLVFGALGLLIAIFLSQSTVIWLLYANLLIIISAAVITFFLFRNAVELTTSI